MTEQDTAASDAKTAAAAAPAAPAAPAVAPLPVEGEPAPASPELRLPRDRPTLVVFLRQCGDPFAEKTFRSLAALSEDRPGLACVAVAQAARDVADRWVAEVGGAWEAEVVADPARDLYARWGLGLNTSWQMFNPRALYATYALGRDEGIWARGWGKKVVAAVPAPATEDPADAAASSSTAAAGNRWQMGGAFAVDTFGAVRWVHVPKASDDIVDFGPVLDMFGLAPLPAKRGADKKTKRRSVSPAPIPEGVRAPYQPHK